MVLCFLEGPQIWWKNNILFNTGEYGQQIARLHNSTSCMIYSKLRLSWIDLGYLLSLSHYSLHTNTHSSDRLVTIMLLPVELLYTHSVSASHSAPALGRLSHFLSFNSVGFFCLFFLSLPLLHNFSLLKLQSRRGETLFPPHELLCCLRAAVMTAPGSAVATRLLRSGFTVDPGSTAQWELFIIPRTHSHCRSQLTAHLPAARGAANRDTQSLKETHTDGHKKIQAHTHTSGSSILHPRW